MYLKVIENVLPNSFANEISDLVINGSFSWLYSPHTVYTNKQITNPFVKETTLFCSTLCMNGEVKSEYFSLLYPMKYFLESEFDGYRINRILVNFLPKNPHWEDIMYNTPHHDNGYINPGLDYKTILYYINTCDGDTLFFNKYGIKNDNGKIIDTLEDVVDECTPDQIIHRQTPKKNTAVVFDSKIMHCSIPSKTSNRFVINIVLEK